MTHRRWLFLFFVILLVDCYLFFHIYRIHLWFRAEEAHQSSHCAIIHQPPSGCPKNYDLESVPRFTESDGSKEFACVSRSESAEDCVDVLKPGEGMVFGFRLQEPEQNAEDASKGKGKI